jgi:hypothetical protein
MMFIRLVAVVLWILSLGSILAGLALWVEGIEHRNPEHLLWAACLLGCGLGHRLGAHSLLRQLTPERLLSRHFILFRAFCEPAVYFLIAFPVTFNLSGDDRNLHLLYGLMFSFVFWFVGVIIIVVQPAAITWRSLAFLNWGWLPLLLVIVPLLAYGWNTMTGTPAVLFR